MKRMLLPSVLGLFIFFFIFVNKALAVTTSISDVPGSITLDSFTVTIIVSGAATGTNYLRGDFYKYGTTNYFGETNNGSSWYGDSDYLQYFPISVISGSDSSVSLQIRMGSPSSTEYDGTGTYKLRVRRYTGLGSYSSSEANNGSVDITIATATPTSIPTATPTIAPSATPTNVPTSVLTLTPTKTPTPIPAIKTPTSTPKSPTATLKATATPSPTSKPIPTTTPKKSSAVVAQDIGPTSVLGIAQEEKPSPTPSQEKNNTTNYLPFILIGIGIVFIAGFGILIYHPFGLLKQEE